MQARMSQMHIEFKLELMAAARMHECSLQQCELQTAITQHAILPGIDAQL